jgi:hypothetical protein
MSWFSLMLKLPGKTLHVGLSNTQTIEAVKKFHGFIQFAAPLPCDEVENPMAMMLGGGTQKLGDHIAWAGSSQ